MDETQNPTLSDKVKAARLQARDIIRLGMINRRFAKIYDLNLDLAAYKKDVETTAKRLAVLVYEKNKALDVDHPNYEETLKATEERIKNATEDAASTTKCLEDAIAEVTKAIADLEKEVTDIEAGEKKVNISEINDLSAQILAKV